MTHRPRRSLGQNFLVDRGFRARIVEAVDIRPGETVVEIGPGRGALTDGLVQAVGARGGRLVLVELDDELAGALTDRYRGRPDITVVRGDILDHSLQSLAADVKLLSVVGNIPYNLTSPILFHVLRPPRPRELLLTVQVEVADRILAEPGTREYGALTVGVRSAAEVERVLMVPAGAFRPRPKVDSAVIRIRPMRPAPMTPDEEGRLRDLTRALFQWRRKQLGKILREHPDLRLVPADVERALAAAGAAATDRPEEVGPPELVALTRSLPAR